MKICIARNDRMGDMILTLPIIKSIKIANPSSEIHIYGSNKNTKIIKHFKYISKVFSVDDKQNFRKEKYDFFFNFSPVGKVFFYVYFLIQKKNTI